jgi:hypothetical protein
MTFILNRNNQLENMHNRLWEYSHNRLCCAASVKDKLFESLWYTVADDLEEVLSDELGS